MQARMEEGHATGLAYVMFFLAAASKLRGMMPGHAMFALCGMAIAVLHKPASHGAAFVCPCTGHNMRAATVMHACIAHDMHHWWCAHTYEAQWQPCRQHWGMQPMAFHDGGTGGGAWFFSEAMWL